MKFNKEMLKRYSTYANAVALIIGGIMIYLPDMVPGKYVPYVMCACSTIVTACQVFKQEIKHVMDNTD
ncbi:hypothetical protein KKJFFJLC_00029 [Vibrio phage vB_VpaS_PGB]|nr:hypothetical protein HHKILHMN_00005 [Vibrio phage vB_VpaS_PGA]WVH05572.1 hypothetical protein KKJFFJLC_00029 [Vibrio phage vB_VpaS_PGB]